MELLFYTTSQCHLCELAEALLVRYGTRIPVLRRNDTGAELDWPFTRDQLLTFLQ
jgi:hypothetical protein